MSVLNTKSDIERIFHFFNKKPNLPATLSDKVNSKKQKIIEEKSCPTVQTSELRCDVLTENNDKLKLENKICNIESSKTFLSETSKKILLKNDDPEAISKNKKSATQKSANVSNASSIDEIKNTRKNYRGLNNPFPSEFKGQKFDKKLLAMQDLIYLNPVTNPIVKEANVEQKQGHVPDNDLLPIEPNQKSVSNNCITPCIKVDVDGKIIIDQKTSTLNETGLEEKQEKLANAKVIEESAFNKRSYRSYRKRDPLKLWTKEETLKFYKCLMNLGTDFSLFRDFIPTRTRDQIKRKYKNEEKKNPQRINDALANTIQYDRVGLENMFKKDNPEVIEVTKNQAKSEANAQPPTRKHSHQNVVRSKGSQINESASTNEKEIMLKNKRKISSKIPTASSVKKEITALQSKLEKKRKPAPLITKVNKKREILSLKVCEKKEESIPKVRMLQDFHNEYAENITKYEGDSNSE